MHSSKKIDSNTILLNPYEKMPALDPHCTIPGASVVRDYACTLSQADVEQNKNKFYIIQLLKNGSTYYVWARYGRTGEPKGSIRSETFTQEHEAITVFCKRYYEKTGNRWGVDPFVPKKNKYVEIEMEEPEVVQDTNSSSSTSSLDPRVVRVVEMFSSEKLMKSTLTLLDVDISKFPIGKISKTQIAKGEEILKVLRLYIEQSKTATANNLSRFGYSDAGEFIASRVLTLSSEFWSLIPYASSRNKPPPKISTPEQLSKCVELLEVIGNIGITAKIIEKKQSIDTVYDGLRTSMVPIDSGTDEWNMLCTYVSRTHGSTHPYRLDVQEIFAIDRVDHNAKLDPKNYFASVGNHRLLFHGSRMSNTVGIFSEGLRVPRPHQIVNGATLGPGIYLADSVTKSFNYCCAEPPENIGFVLVVEAALGQSDDVRTMKGDPLPRGCTSRKANGDWTPDETEFVKWSKDDKVVIPSGKLIPQTRLSGPCTFQYNEYVVFDPRLYRLRYLLVLKKV